MRTKRNLKLKKEKKLEKLVKRVEQAPKGVRPIPNKVTQLTNLNSKSDFSAGEVTMATALAAVDPFRAYEMQAQVSLPFDQTAQQVFGLWTRDIYNVAGVADAAGNKTVLAFVHPWSKDSFTLGTTVSATGVVSASSQQDSVSQTFLSSNFDRACVTHQGIRVRNLTSVLSQAGEITVGECRWADAFTATYFQRRVGQKSYTRAAAGPEVTAQVNWIGQSDGDVEAADTISDYQMADTAGDVFDDDLTTNYVQAISGADIQLEIEVVRHWLLLPTLNVQAFLPMQRLSVNVNKVLSTMDMCYLRSGRFSIARCAIKDDGGVVDDLKGIWGGIKSLVRLPGNVWQGLSSALSEDSLDVKLYHLLRTVTPDVFRHFLLVAPKYPDLPTLLRSLRPRRVVVHDRFREEDFDHLSSASVCSSTSAARPSGRK